MLCTWLSNNGKPSGQATKALLALFTLSPLAPFILCLNILYCLQTIGNRNYLSYCEQGLVKLGSEPSKSKCKSRCYRFFNPNIDEAFQTQRASFFFSFCDMKRVAGMVVLQKLKKALVHSSDVTLNIRFFKVGKRWLYSTHGFLRGSCGSSGKALDYGLDGPGSVPGVGRVEISFTPSCPDCPWDPHSLL